MNTHFQALLKQAKANTASASEEAAKLLAQRQAEQKKARQEAEAREAKEKARTKAILMRQVEEKKKAEIERVRMEAEKVKRAEEAARREKEEVRLPLAVKAVKAASSKSRSASPLATGSSAHALTREEKRALNNPLYRDEMLRSRANAKKAASTNGRKPGTEGTIQRKMGSGMITLTKLNTNKRDRRSVDEIARDLERAKSQKTELTGSDAATFTDWFGNSKKEKEQQGGRREPDAKGGAAAKGKRADFESPASISMKGSSSKFTSPLASSSRSAPTSSSYSSAVANGKQKAPPLPSKSLSSQSSRPGASNGRPAPSSASKARDLGARKRGRSAEDEYDSEEFSDDYSRKRPRATGGYVPGSIAAMFGRDLRKDSARDVFSDDDEDMEAHDYTTIEQEEAKSARLARKEDREAEEEEKRREAAKREKKKLKAAGGNGR